MVAFELIDEDQKQEILEIWDHEGGDPLYIGQSRGYYSDDDAIYFLGG